MAKFRGEGGHVSWASEASEEGFGEEAGVWG